MAEGDRRETGTDDRFARIEARAKARRIAAEAREEARRARHDERARLAAADPHAPGARQPRGSGRKDVVRERRDTTGYAMIVDADRIRALAARGASVDSLTAVLGIDAQEIEQVLNAPAQARGGGGSGAIVPGGATGTAGSP